MKREEAKLFAALPDHVSGKESCADILQEAAAEMSIYAGMIRSLNGVQNLDPLPVGTTYYLPTTPENVQPGFAVAVVCHVMRYGENAADVFYDYGINYGRYSNILLAFNGEADANGLSELHESHALVAPYSATILAEK